MNIVFLLTLILLGISSILFSLFLFKKKKALFGMGRWILWAGFGMWSLELLVKTKELGVLPVYDLRSSLFFWGWCGIFVYLLLQIKFRLTVLSAFIAPLAFVLALVSGTLPSSSGPLKPYLKGLWFHLHVIPMFLGIAFFFLSAVAAGLYLWVDRALKSRKMSTFSFQLPSLAGLDQMGHYTVTYGFPLYSIGMMAGALYAQATFGKYWQWDPKEVWALVTWLLYAILLHERLALGWKGKKAATLTLVCFCALLFTYLVISHLGEGYHSFKSLSGG